MYLYRIEKQFAKDVERTGKGRWNNAGDMNQPMSLSTDFMKIYNSEWMEVMRRLFGQENELKGIRFLSKTIKVLSVDNLSYASILLPIFICLNL